MPKTTESFYKSLPVLSSFEEVTNSSNHHQLPEDWHIIVTDIVDSTFAIQNGCYKDVNTIGGSIVVSILNIDRGIPIPFVYGGDGAILAIPEFMRERAISALIATQTMALASFDLELRIGMIPAKDLALKSARCGVAKWRLSPSVTQAAFSGDGWSIAEQLIKDPVMHKKYEAKIQDGLEPFADYSGFECRWKQVPNRNGHQLALLVQSAVKDPQEHTLIYREVIAKIEEIYGEVKDFHPLSVDRMRLSAKPTDLRSEAKIKSHGGSKSSWILKCLKLWILNFIGMYLIRTGEKKQTIPWGKYRQELIENADFRKFDGVLRMILDGNNQQGLEIGNYLNEQSKKGRLCFGLHKSKAAVVTCIVFSHQDHHTHFVDGGDGGYALAAQMLKRQLKRVSENLQTS